MLLYSFALMRLRGLTTCEHLLPRIEPSGRSAPGTRNKPPATLPKRTASRRVAGLVSAAQAADQTA